MCFFIFGVLILALIVGAIIYGFVFAGSVIVQAIVWLKAPKWGIWVLPGLVAVYEIYSMYQMFSDENYELTGMYTLFIVFFKALLPFVLVMEAKILDFGKRKYEEFKEKRENKDQ